MTRLSALSWPPTPDNAAAWRAACTTSGGGDLGADSDDGGPYLELHDDSPEPPTFLANLAPRKATP